MKFLYLVSIFLIALQINALEKMPEITLQGDAGGRLDGTKWSSSEIKDKVYVLFYVDPDEKDLNEHVSEALKANKFPLDKYGSIAIINMDATWLPNGILESSLESKQEKYPDTLYIKDFDKLIVKKWKLADDSNNIVLFNKKGEVLIKIMGKASDIQKSQIINLIKLNLNK